MAAKLALGMALSTSLASTTASAKINPWKMALALDWAPLWAFTLERTTTDVTGKPPTRPDRALPAPWASNSRLVGVTRFRGSNLSAASIDRRDSKLATRAMVSATIHTARSDRPCQLGVFQELNPEPSSTLWLCSRTQSEPSIWSTGTSTRPNTTAIRAAGRSRPAVFWAQPAASARNITKRDKEPMTAAGGEIRHRACSNPVKVFSLVGCSKFSSPMKSTSYPTR